MYKILWSEWHDPLAEMMYDDDDDDIDDDDDDDEDESEVKLKRKNFSHLLVNHLGVMPIDEKSLISNRRKLWEANTNFDITPKIVKIVSQVPGVEILRVLTRYSMIVGFGLAFNDNSIKNNIDKILVGGSRLDKKVDRFDIIKKEVISQYPCWAIFVLPDGAIEYCGNKEIQPVLNCIKEYKSKNSGCKIFTSLD